MISRKTNRLAGLAVTAIVFACFSAVRPSSALADAAFALGLPGNVAEDGVSFGWRINAPDAEQAAADALARCRGDASATQTARDLCRIVKTFDGACLSVALDPDPDTAGFGWAVADAPRDAVRGAMKACRESAGARAMRCRVDVTPCDRQKPD